MKFLLILLLTFQGQVLHHQMISAQVLQKNITRWCFYHKLLDSSVGTSSFDYVIQQDFNRVLGKYIAQIHRENKINTYPNPFIQTLNFEFSKLFQMM
jgi:hypothetical protein